MRRDPNSVAEYREALRACILAREILRAHDLPAFIFAIGQAETLAPILDPTLYREKAAAMGEDLALFRAAMTLRQFPAAPTSVHRHGEEGPP